MANKGINHLAIIMDGNGRWAREKGLPRTKGHYQGSQTVKKIVKACINLRIKYLTLYAFSTENWSRPRTEISTLMKLLAEFIRQERDDMNKNNIRLIISGDISRLPRRLQEQIQDTVKLTQKNNKLILNIALNYGGRQEILRAVRQIALDYRDNRINIRHLNEKHFKKYLYHGSLLPDPDLLIRTSGEVRISNFLLWQIAYSELFFTSILWPDFNEAKLRKIVDEYQARDRRFGGL
ncbi:MAG: isoprenyl transferase [bacterium]|nr:isoprenyl transferase [bacterium]